MWVVSIVCTAEVTARSRFNEQHFQKAARHFFTGAKLAHTVALERHIDTVSQKRRHYTLVHIFAKY